MGGKPFRFTGESYAAGRSGVYRLRRKTEFEQVSVPKSKWRFRAVVCREFLPKEEQYRQDFTRLRNVEKELSDSLK